MGLAEKFFHLLERAEQSEEYWRNVVVTDFIRELHARLHQLGVTHIDLAQSVGISESSLSELLDDCDMTLESMVKLAKVLGCRVRVRLES